MVKFSKLFEFVNYSESGKKEKINPREIQLFHGSLLWESNNNSKTKKCENGLSINKVAYQTTWIPLDS